ncbi:MAG: subunit of tubulin prefoldin [Heterodermia speciosa]|uniref:Subunit of tubulin prefoldin n=1 Tax=Heterodermia speciosa TaxID=116794 RepID=A0A8H3EXL8_9LECA|nr:MAG: subunit of tubulin prefoldin [Heterodermia speciosa]
MASNPSAQPQTIDLATLPTAQLTNLKNQLTQDLQHLTTSFQQLRAAQTKFRDCINSVRAGVEKCEEGKEILVPLTPSLYVPGKLASTETVLVDIGTGFYVEKTPAAARTFYSSKVDELGKTLGDLEGIVQQKNGNLRVVEDVLRQKVISENKAGSNDEKGPVGAAAG